MRLRLSLVTLLAAALAFPPPVHAQDTATVRRALTAAKLKQDSIAKRSTSPTIDRQAAATKVLLDSALAAAQIKPVTPPPPPPPPTVLTARVEIRPSTGSFAVGAPVQFTAIPKAADGTTLTSAVSWSASPSSVATISGVGVLTPIAAGSVTVTARADTASKAVAITILPDLPPQPPVVVVDSTSSTPPSVFVVPAGLGGGVAQVAELPRDTAPAPYPAITRQVRLPLIANLQSALNSAQPGDEILLPRGSSFTGDFLLPKHAGAGQASCTAWIVVRTDVPDSLLGAPGVRMTPAKAKALALAKVQTPDNQQAIGTAWGVPNVGCWRLVGLEIQPGPTGNDVNGLVRFGDQNETDSTHQAHHLVVDRSYVHGSAVAVPKNTSTLGQVRRCLVFNSRWNVSVDSWVEYCRGGSGDSQTGLSYAGTGPIRYTNNTLSGGTEVLNFGGAHSGIIGAIPSDVTIHGNTITRDLADTITFVKNWLETKCVQRLDAAGNVFRYNWADGQDGYGVLFKGVNQTNGDGSPGRSTWCRSADVTFRYNLVDSSGNGIKVAGIEEGPAQPTARVTLYQNTLRGIGYRRGNAYGIPFAILGGSGTLSDVTLANNTVAAAPWGLVVYDGGPTARQAWQSNVLYCGGYGAKGNSTPTGLPTLTAFAPGAVWTGNVLYGCTSGYPSGTTYSSSLAAALLSGVGADASKLP